MLGVAEGVGFEPTRESKPPTRLAGGRTKPLCDPSANGIGASISAGYFVGEQPSLPRAEAALLADGGEFDGLEDALLEGGPRWVDVDGVPAARVLTKTAAGALLLDDAGDAEEVADLLAGKIEYKGVKRADVDAELTAGADAVIVDDDRLRPFALGESFGEVAELVRDTLHGTDHSAGATVDA